MKKEEVPLYEKKTKLGRKTKYDYTPFLNPRVACVVIKGYGIQNYNSLRATLTRWKRLNGVNGAFRFEFHMGNEEVLHCWVIWRISKNGRQEQEG